MHLVINQSTDRTEQVTTACIDKLYNLSKSNTLDGTSYLRGSINAAAAYEDAVTFLNTTWGPDLIVTASDYYIRFADPEVESVLKTAFNKAEGEGITTQEAANTVANYFHNNTNIESFDEFRHFKNGRYSFYSCTNLESIDLGSHNSLPDFHNCNNLKYFSGINSDEGVLTIPEEVTLTTIDGQFYRCYGMHTVVVPNTFTSFYARTFAGCDNLKKVIISDLNAWLNISFGSGTANPLWNSGDLYLNDTKITTIDFTNKQNINGCVMYGCASLTSITQLSDITNIGGAAFKNCTNLVIPDLNLPNLVLLNSEAFYNTKVQAISDLGSATSIPEGCFKDCSLLTSVIIPSTLTTIGREAFANCTNLAKIGDVNTNTGELNLPNLTGTLGTSAFQSCNNINKIISLGSITSIGGYAFNIDTLSEIHLPATLTSSDANAFGNWNAPQIDKLYLEGTLEQWLNIDFKGEWANPMDRVVSHFYINNQEITSCIFPTGMTSVKRYVFRNYIPLTTVSLSSTITEIQTRAFSGCSGLTTINTENVTTFGEYSLAYCSLLTSVDLSSAVSIGNYTFRECTSLTSVTVPNSVTKIGNYAFYGCRSLTSITINAVAPPTLGTDVFQNTNNCPIYVPAGSVSAYQSASGWSTYASRIQAIPNS